MRKLISRFSHHLYKKNHKRFLKHNIISASDYSSFLKLSFEKSYSRFSPINYLPGNDFQSYKVLYNFISLNSLSEISGKTVSELSEAYNWDLKYKIRDKAIGLKLHDLSTSWGGEDIALFNCFNTIKFKEKVFKNIPLYGARVLDFGSSIGCASFLASNYGTYNHTISDVPGFPLDVAERSLKKCGLQVNKIPINDPSAPPEYQKNEFDIVYCLHTLEHTTNPIKTCSNILNSLRSGGYIIYTYYKASSPDGINTEEALYYREETLNLLKENTISTKINNLKPFIVAIKK